MIRPSVNGVLVVDKPSGPTSFDIVAQARRFFGTRQVGHAGTLDPLASGVLLLLLGEATKLSSYLTLASKTYLATLQLGTSTDTLDAEGQVTARSDVFHFSDAHLEHCLRGERERSLQVPPNFSAIKVAGKKAYSMARQGADLNLAPRSVQVKHLELLSRTSDSIALELCVSKGYYVRSLARDLCLALNVPGHLSGLRRITSGCFNIEEASIWPPDASPSLLSLGEAVKRSLPCASLTEVGELRARQGKHLDVTHFDSPPTETPCAWLNANSELVAIGATEGETYRVVRGFNTVSPDTATPSEDSAAHSEVDFA